MHSFILKAEEQMSLSQSVKHYFGGDGDRWITTGIRDYFPNATYILCPSETRNILAAEKSTHKNLTQTDANKQCQ
jgi:hypothetical protein